MNESVQKGTVAPQASFSMGTGVSCGMKRPGRETDYLPAPTATCFLEMNTALAAQVHKSWVSRRRGD